MSLGADSTESSERLVTTVTDHARTMADAAIHAVDPVTAVRDHVRKLVDLSSTAAANHTSIPGTKATLLQIGIDPHNMVNLSLSDYDHILIVAFGKASSAMATALLERLTEGQPATNQLPSISGLVIVKDGHATPQQLEILQQSRYNISVREASHPVPDQRGVDASRKLLDLVHTYASPRTLVFALLSGGGSALFCAPHESLTLLDLQQTNQALLQSGWSITDMNVVRKRLETGKGGRLAAAAHPGTVVSLILSDVLGDPLDLIASGPTVPDTSTWSDAWALAETLPEKALPDAVRRLLRAGVDGHLPDSPSPSHGVFARAVTCLVGNNAKAVTAAATTAQRLGYHPVILGTRTEGEARQVARWLVQLAQHLALPETPSKQFSLASLPAALICGGETTVTLPEQSQKHGKGGRNQELALAAALELQRVGLNSKNDVVVVVASVGTDGTDGPTDAAGAIVDGHTVDRLPGDALLALETHNAYPYLAQTDANGRSPLLKVRRSAGQTYVLLEHTRNASTVSGGIYGLVILTCWIQFFYRDRPARREPMWLTFILF
jgi:glycerate-2-kinase